VKRKKRIASTTAMHACAWLVLLATVAGCSGDGAGDSSSQAKPTLSGDMAADSRPPVTVQSLGGTASVHGVARYEGTAPTSHVVNVAGDPFCVEARGKSFIDPDMIVSAAGGVQNVFVYLQAGVPEYRFMVPEEPVRVDQSGCQYEPRVLGVQVGQTLQFSNSDQTLHNVHSVVDRNIGNKAFNFGMPARAGVRIDKKFETSEVMARIKCDVHPWMVAWVGVLPHPWFGVTDVTGAFRIDHVPDGEYVVAAWHERLGHTTAPIRVSGGVGSMLEILFPELNDASN
jgi:plastocyanin